MIGLAKFQADAIAIGFDPEGEYRGYGVEVFTPFILEDPKVIAEFDKNWLRELAECPQQSHPDDVLMATLASFSETEKAALRRRVQFKKEEWANA
jgi:hypothetical protein